MEKKDFNGKTVNYFMSAIAWVLSIAGFVILVWLVQQTQAQQEIITKILIQTSPNYASWETKKPVKVVSTDVKSSNTNEKKENLSPKKVSPKSANIPKPAKSLLNSAYARLKKARSFSKSGKFSSALNEIQLIKDEIWKAGDMLPPKAKASLRKLMGSLDYSKSQLGQNKKGDLLTPMRIVKGVLNGTI